MDELTMMIDTVTTSRGILYTYQLNLHQDDLIDFRPVFNSIKSTALEALCNNPAMIWYKNNEVEMTYEYLDKDDPTYKEGFKVSSHNKSLQNYIKSREKAENKKNLFLEKIADEDTTKDEMIELSLIHI